MQLTENMYFGENNRYYLEKLLGRGGFSEVWLVKDSITNLELALKVYAPGMGMDEDGLQTFSQELARVYNLNHTNLLKPQHVDSWQGMPYLTMSYCPQGSLVKRIGKMSEQEIRKVIHDVAAGLAYLHERDIIHQDIKPDNILIDSVGNYVITDFGISTRARSTLRKSVAASSANSGGTIAYMGPERFGKEPAPIKASDIWSLGAMCYELMIGNTPFGEHGGLIQKSGAEVPNIQGNYSNELKQIVEQMLSLDPWDRPTAAALAEGHFSTPAPERNRPTVAKPTSRSAQPTIISTTGNGTIKTYSTQNNIKTTSEKKKTGWIIGCLLLLAALVGGICVYVNNSNVQTYSTAQQIQSVPVVVEEVYEPETIDKNRVQTLLTNISRCSSRGGNYSLLSHYYTYEINPYVRAGVNRYNYDIGEKIKAYVEKFPKYEISDPYNFSYLNTSFPLTVKCDVLVNWVNTKGVSRKAIIHKTYYITADYKVSGFTDEQVNL